MIESGITLFQLIDQYTFFDIMKWFGNYSAYQLNTVYALFSFNANKLYMIIISLASAMAATAIPLLAGPGLKMTFKTCGAKLKTPCCSFTSSWYRRP